MTMNLFKNLHAMKKISMLITASFLLVSTACAHESKDAKSSATGELSNMKISIQITSESGNHTLTAMLENNSSAVAFYELLKKGSAYS